MAKVNNERILMIVESPNKTRTLKQFLPDNYIIMASVGHIAKIDNCGLYNMGIDVDNNFKESYIIDPGKKEVVDKLKEQVKFASKVILASDPDREGEAIAWFLKTFLELDKLKKPYERIVYHEITKKAIEQALANPRQIDDNYVCAARVRADEDKIVGFVLSKISRDMGKGRSVGNVQSPCLGLIVDLEEQIDNFKPETYYDIYLNFIKDNVEFKAKYLSKEKIMDKKIVDKIISDCSKGKYIVSNITKKESKENPKPPFITNTYLQEMSNRLNLSTEQAMSCAQKLFEGIDVNHEHMALITYHRTDSVEIAQEFKDPVNEFIKNNYYDKLFIGQKKVKNSQNAQAGHECIRPVDVNMTPEKLKNYIKDDLLIKVYTLIWKRAVQSLLAPAIYNNKIITIANGEHLFELKFKNIKDKGFKLLD